MENKISLYKLFGKFMGQEIVMPDISDVKKARNALRENFNELDQIAGANNLTTRITYGNKPDDIGIDEANKGRVNVIVAPDTTGKKRIVEIALG